jgi:hypothetical protein
MRSISKSRLSLIYSQTTVEVDLNEMLAGKTDLREAAETIAELVPPNPDISRVNLTAAAGRRTLSCSKSPANGLQHNGFCI